MENRKTVLLADTNEEFRTILRGMIEKTEEFTVVGTTGNGTEVLSLLSQHKPDLLVMDLMLPGIDGMTLLQQMQSQGNMLPPPAVQIGSSATPWRWVPAIFCPSPARWRPWWTRYGTCLSGL